MVLVRHKLEGLGEFVYLRNLVCLFEAMYVSNESLHLSNREKDFFTTLLMGLRRKVDDFNSSEMKSLFETHYLKESINEENAKRVRSLLATMRKNLAKKEVIEYDKNTMKFSVAGNWYYHDSLQVEAKFSR